MGEGGEAAFASPGALKNHYMSSHKPVERIPSEAYITQSICSCPHCPTLFVMKAGANIGGGCVYLNNHLKKHHPQLQEGQGTPADLPPIPEVPLHAPAADPYLTNQAFFESLSLDSHEFHQVHGSSITQIFLA